MSATDILHWCPRKTDTFFVSVPEVGLSTYISGYSA